MITEVIYFLNEVELLQAHLEHHRPWGWRTVIVEADVTVSGVPKPRFFQENRSLFEKYDVEHVILPSDLFPLIQGEDRYRQFRKNDWAKRLWMQDNFDCKNPWIFHSDVDEILEYGVKSEDLVDVEYICFNLENFTIHVNRMLPERQNAYRLAKSDLSPLLLQKVKRNRRRSIYGGWHFTNCFSTEEQARLKAKCRPWQPEEDFTNPETPESTVIRVTELPGWMQDNLHLFPVAEESDEP